MTLSERSDSLGTDSLTAVALVTPVLLLMQNMPQGAMGAGKSIVFSMLADDSALHAALSGDDGLLAGLRKGASTSRSVRSPSPPLTRSRRCITSAGSAMSRRR